MATEWISHVKKTQQEKGCSYKEAMKHASKTWKKSGSGFFDKKKTQPINESYDDETTAMETKRDTRRREEAKEPERKPVRPDRLNSGNVKDPRHKRFK